MLLFSTILNIDNSLTKDEFLKLVIEWNQGSRHNDNIITNLMWDGSYNQKFGNEKVSLDFKEYRNEDILAVRYEKKLDDGVIWNTDYIMNFKESKMSIMLDRSFTEDAINVDRSFKTPVFIKLLIEKGYVLDDNNLPITMNPHWINDENYQMLVEVINGAKVYDLPIVYVLKTFLNRTPIDVGKLSYALKGVAHVFVQEDVSSNDLIRSFCDDKNEYNGNIGIYYQTDMIQKKRRRVLEHFDPDVVSQSIVRDIIHYTNQQTIPYLYTWDGVLTSLFQDRFRSQKAKRAEAEKTKEETDEVLRVFSDEMNDLEEENKRLTSKLLDRENELEYYKNEFFNRQGVNEGFLSSGTEKEFFQGEKRAFVLSVLSDSLGGMSDKTRKKHIIQDIVQQNEIDDILNNRRDEIKRLLTDYKGINSKLKQELKKLGFVVSEDGTHYKLTYYNDNRYTIVMAKTPSDSRAGKNNVSEINKKVL